MEALARLGSDARRGGIGMTLGIELPLDNDFSSERIERLRNGQAPGETFGIPDLSRHLEWARLVDRLGFRALWMRDVPMWLPRPLAMPGRSSSR